MRAVNRLSFVGVFLLFAGAVSFGASPVNTTLFGNLAIKGYDTVHYFTDGGSAKGSKKFEFEYNGANWRFVSQSNLDLFKTDPERYAPQYGGYCAWAVSQGDTANIDPDSWKIVDGKLYLNYNKEIQAKWEKDQSELIKKADRNWPGILADGQ